MRGGWQPRTRQRRRAGWEPLGKRLHHRRRRGQTRGVTAFATAGAMAAMTAGTMADMTAGVKAGWRRGTTAAAKRPGRGRGEWWKRRWAVRCGGSARSSAAAASCTLSWVRRCQVPALAHAPCAALATRVSDRALCAGSSRHATYPLTAPAGDPFLRTMSAAYLATPPAALRSRSGPE